MQAANSRCLVLVLSVFCGFFLADAASAATSRGGGGGVFGGGPLYSDAEKLVPVLRSSGFATLVLWSLHVDEVGDLFFNDKPLVRDGRYVASPAWPAQIASLKQPPTTLDRLEWCIGSAEADDFAHLGALLAAGAGRPGGRLARNFGVLKQLFPSVDAVSLDDETSYDTAATINLTSFLAPYGFHVTLTPFSNGPHWQAVFERSNAAFPGLIDRVYLQAYAGGFRNSAEEWAAYVPGLKIDVGLWSRHGHGCDLGSTPSEVAAYFAPANRSAMRGGWLWLLDDILECDAQFPLKDYAAAVTF